jgi:hypothetical protein
VVLPLGAATINAERGLLAWLDGTADQRRIAGMGEFVMSQE